MSTLPTDLFDRTLAGLSGLPDGAETQPTLVQSQDFYGNVASFMVQTVRHDGGNSVFITQVNAEGSARYILPPKVVTTILRQQDAITHMLRRRHGKRLAETARIEGRTPTFTPEARAKALATRRAKAATRKLRKMRGGR